MPAGNKAATRTQPKGVECSGRSTVWAAGLLLLLGLAAYGNSLGNDFVIDDRPIILGDVRVQQCRIRALLTGEYWSGICGDPLYRPLPMVSLAVNWAVSHAPWTFRLPNLLLHIGVSLVLFTLARDWMKSAWPALAAAACFVVHPIHTAVLNGVVGRADLGAALFGLLAIFLWWRDGADPARGGWKRPLGAALSALAGALFKENALTLVGVIVLLDVAFWRPGDRTRPQGWWGRRLRRCYAPLLIVLTIYFGARWAALGRVTRSAAEIGAVDNIIACPEYGLQPGDSRFLARWGTPLAVFGKAAGLMVVPHPLCWDYSYATIDSVKRLGDPRLIGGALWLVGCAGAMAWSWRRKRLVFVAFGITLVTYSIVSNTFVVIGTIFAERLLYFPSVGFCFLAGCLWWACFQFARRKVGRPAAAMLIGVLAIGVGWGSWMTVVRNRDWQSDRTLNAADILDNPHSSRMWAAVATDALNRKELKTAVKDAEKAIAISPEHGTAWCVMGLAQWQLGEADQALTSFDRFFRLGGLRHAQAPRVAAAILQSRGDYRGAIELLKKAAAANPNAAIARNNLAWYLLTAEPVELRDTAAAAAYARSAVELAPGQGDIIDTYISALAALGRHAEATRELERLLPAVAADDPYRAALHERLAELRRPSPGN